MTPNPANPMPVAPPQQPQKKGGISGVLIAVIVVALLCPCIGILSAIAIPNFIKFQARSKQAEAKVNLKGAYMAERVQFETNNAYSTDVSELGWSVEPGNRYMYSLGPDGDLAEPGAAVKGSAGFKADSKRFPTIDNDAIEKGVPQAVWNGSGVEGECPKDCSITIVAAGNVDNDDTIDVWTVSTKDRVINGVPVSAGQPYNDVNDIAE